MKDDVEEKLRRIQTLYEAALFGFAVAYFVAAIYFIFLG